MEAGVDAGVDAHRHIGGSMSGRMGIRAVFACGMCDAEAANRKEDVALHIRRQQKENIASSESMHAHQTATRKVQAMSR